MVAGQVGGERVELAARAREEAEHRAARGERLGQRAADPGRGAGHERPRARGHLHGGGA
jgi:hypothetical protein